MMPTIEKIYFAIMSGVRDKNIKFSELQKLLETLGFQCRIKGDHFIYYERRDRRNNQYSARRE